MSTEPTTQLPAESPSARLIGSAWCQWGRLSRSGVCGKLATCDVDDSEGKPIPTCQEHQAVAHKLEWEIRLWPNDQAQQTAQMAPDKRS
jgi:hypothetical protein